jgi:DNA-directed RNA polymerase subunit RPC12/RpoP
MKLTKNTIPQAKNYVCDDCKKICSHKQMYDDNICEDCKFNR